MSGTRGGNGTRTRAGSAEGAPPGRAPGDRVARSGRREADAEAAAGAAPAGSGRAVRAGITAGGAAGSLGAVLTACVLVAAPAAGQETAGGPGDGLPEEIELPAGRDSLLRVEDRPGEGRLEMRVGPVSLDARTPHVRLPVQMAEWPVEGWLQGFSWEVRDADGRRLPDALLHHVNVIDPDHRQLFSPIPRRLVAAGRETKSQRLPGIAGVPVGRGTRLMVAAMLANPTSRDHEAVYLHLALEYTDRSDALLPRLDVHPFYLDVMGPVGDKSFAVPPGRTVKSWTGSPATNARILGVGGHLHDFAAELRLEDLTTGDTVWQVEPVTEGRHHVTGVPVDQLWWSGGRPIYADHRYRVTVIYENPTDRPAPHGGMGVVAGVVYAREGYWARVDRSDPAYLADLWNTVTAPRRAHRRHGRVPAHGAVPGTLQSPEEWGKVAAPGEREGAGAPR